MPFAIATATLASILFAAAWIDIRTHRLPNWLTLPLIVVGLSLSALSLSNLPTPPFLEVFLGAALGYGLLVLVEKLYERLRGRAGLGRGDAKLLAAGGAWCGVAALPAILFLASASGLVWILIERLRGKAVTADMRLPFGPFLALGILGAWLYGSLLPSR